uniref:TLR adapter interacting with SLC15A4 on the lysosome isoform X2 n=1 Tax=Scatophagus argus TaxID=75038 RepID=UPI001ED85F03|nr:TLR adapter interacting with SLC15A4 on the lysosome isoform X2 [Scatophagus argus]XP_046260230.1 TLR adapter interacting with SLC15A4 on the lysosome isoform X2 [Scatophagus argus]XP_046260231.1 TLR adapter interacting with SLC15A4 on the lysosome isoform X2 [Scatophagus argus]XP_046260232.1 TLR adapter interacting with SLC15A4 on the lysosome isoform X2 [Scatophagus argus]XP_046260233.1 TLR adapter interacting with SLC15A4 on the lysosome isoform X2 [Scatophagus argus]
MKSTSACPSSALLLLGFPVASRGSLHTRVLIEASRTGKQAMLCEGRLLSMTYGELGDLDPLPPQEALRSAYGLPRPAAALMPGSTRRAPPVQHNFSVQTGYLDNRSVSVEMYCSLLQSSDLLTGQPGRLISPEIEIPAQACSGGDSPFLVPSFCQSICQNYSDLYIGGEQVLPLSANDGELRVGTDAQAVCPFLQSCDVLPAVEDSPPGQTSQGGLLHPLRGGSNRWRVGSGRDRSFLFQDHEGPFSNSLLNRYLEQKLMDLYQQYIMENMARDGDSDAGPICPLLSSELVLTSLDQITLQLSREGNLEASLAKDMVLSCLLRVAGDKQSSELSTPFLQISNEASREQLTENKEE